MCRQLPFMLSADPVLQEPHWRGVAERGMEAPAVVERLDVVEQVGLRFGPHGVAGAMHPLILQAVEEALARRVVPAISLAAHRAGHPVLFQLRLKGEARILAAPVGVMDQARRRLPAEPGHGQRIDDDVCRHPRLDRPADDFPVEQIEHYSQIQPALASSDIGHVGCPDLIRHGRREALVEQVRHHRQRVLRVSRGFELLLVARPDAVLAHQPFDAFLAGRESALTQFAHHPWRAVGALEFGVDGLNQGQHLRVRQPLALRRATALPGLITADADVQNGAGLRQSTGSVKRVNPGMLHSTSLAKYAVAFFRISFSRLSRMFSARTRESSICSGVTTLVPRPLSLPAAAAITQLRSVCSTSLSSRATAPMLWPAFTRFTANSLNSAVYSCSGIFFNFASPPSFTGRYTQFPGRRNFGGAHSDLQGLAA